jgi:hypothetical protein
MQSRRILGGDQKKFPQLKKFFSGLIYATFGTSYLGARKSKQNHCTESITIEKSVQQQRDEKQSATQKQKRGMMLC